MKWATVRFSELFRVKHGHAFKSAFFDSSGPYVLLTPGSFHEEGGYRDQGEKMKFYMGDIPDGFILDDGDLLVVMTEQAPGLLGSSAWIPESNRFLHNQRLGRVVDLDERRVDKRFLYYLFNTREVRQQISGSASGTKVRHTAPERIGRVEVSLPPHAVQRSIAGTATAYDDLIQNNTRRMALLEQLARLLYQEWFVRLRFPGHEHTRITKGIPQGWARKTAHEALQILSGGTPKTSVPEYWGGEIPFYTPKDAPDGVWVTDCERTITDVGLSKCNSRLFPKETVFISARGTVGKLNMAQRPMAMSQSCYALVGKGHLTQPFVFCAMQEGVEALRQQAVGAVFDAIIVDTFKRISFLIPQPKTVRLFDEVARPVLAQLENLTLQNQKLRAARDLLLPRLMSGEIAV
jgi:type I restriction enzyme S subunit